ncbi:MAG: hypothetical protein Q7K57_35555 [Burkholderiaceae bacterium]|nr:hypothetical protein [Burkholderiaceae bacterium]
MSKHPPSSKTRSIDAAANPQPPQPKLPHRLYAVVKEGRLLGAIKRRIKPMVIRLGQSAMKHPLLKRLALGGLNYMPGLKVRLHRILWSEVNLSPRGLRIYTELKAAIEAQSLAKTEQQLESRA